MTRIFLRLVPLVAAAIAVPRVLDHFGARDVSWAPPEYALAPVDERPPAVDAGRVDTPRVERPPGDEFAWRPERTFLVERRVTMCSAGALEDVTLGPAWWSFDGFAP